MSKTIRVTDEVHAELVRRAQYGDSIDKVIRSLLFMVEKWEEVGKALYHEHVTRERSELYAREEKTANR